MSRIDPEGYRPPRIIGEEIVASGEFAADRGEADAFRSIVRTIADGVVVVDHAGITRFVNPAAEHLFGRPAADLIGHEFGFPIVNGETAELELLHPVRGPVKAELRVTAATWDGEPALLASIRDITERVRAQERERQLVREQALRLAAEASERRARFLSEAASTLAASLDYRATLWNLAQLAVPFLGDWCIVDLLDPDGTFERVAVATSSARGAALAAALKRHTPTMDPQSGAARALRSGEPIIAVDPGASAVSGVLGVREDEPTLKHAALGACMVLPLVVRDTRVGLLTLCAAESGRMFDDGDLELAAEVARRAAAAVDNGRLYTAAQQANQAKADFLAIMSHELRTPLNAIIGYADLLDAGIHGELGEKQKEQLARIRRSSDHLRALIEQILAHTRLEAGRAEPSWSSVDAGAVLREAVQLVHPAARRKGLALNVETPTSLPLETDATYLRQILLNLLENAVKFTGEGSVTASAESVDGYAEFRVVDTGTGIAPEHLDSVFEAFWQAEQGKTRRAEGTGLGLSVARRLAQLLGGSVEAVSELGRGTTMIVRLPLRRA